MIVDVISLGDAQCTCSRLGQRPLPRPPSKERKDPRTHRFYERCGFEPGLRISYAVNNCTSVVLAPKPGDEWQHFPETRAVARLVGDLAR
jgi:hypothetical protein